MTALEKFQGLLRELFQFDCADLDFGIYRITNRKRDVVERFITKDLPKTVRQQLNQGALKEQSGLAQHLAELADQIRGDHGNPATCRREIRIRTGYIQSPAPLDGCSTVRLLEDIG